MTAWAKPKLTLCLIVACILTFTACGGGNGASSTETTPAPTAQAAVWPGADWEVSTPETEGMDAARLEDVSTYCEAHGCRAVVIVRHGRIAWERYWGGWDKASTDNSWSMAKSVTSALVGIAIAQGKIKSIDQTASDFIPEWRGNNRQRITIGDLLSMMSGLTWTMVLDPPSGDTMTMLARDDEVAYALNRQIYREPGTDWYYSDGDAETFSRILKMATGMEAGQYAQQQLFGPIGLKADEWTTDKLGQTMTWCCIHSSARDFARFGYLFLRNGRWGDKQVVPEDWVNESTQPSRMENTSYGYFWWLLDFPDVPRDMYAAMGFGTKRTYVIPSLDIVAVRLGEGDELGWDDNAFLKAIVDATAAQ